MASSAASRAVAMGRHREADNSWPAEDWLVPGGSSGGSAAAKSGLESRNGKRGPRTKIQFCSERLRDDLGVAKVATAQDRRRAPTAKTEGFMLAPEDQHFTSNAGSEGPAYKCRSVRTRRAPPRPPLKDADLTRLIGHQGAGASP